MKLCGQFESKIMAVLVVIVVIFANFSAVSVEMEPCSNGKQRVSVAGRENGETACCNPGEEAYAYMIINDNLELEYDSTKCCAGEVYETIEGFKCCEKGSKVFVPLSHVGGEKKPGYPKCCAGEVHETREGLVCCEKGQIPYIKTKAYGDVPSCCSGEVHEDVEGSCCCEKGQTPFTPTYFTSDGKEEKSRSPECCSGEIYESVKGRKCCEAGNEIINLKETDYSVCCRKGSADAMKKWNNSCALLKKVLDCDSDCGEKILGKKVFTTADDEKLFEDCCYYTGVFDTEKSLKDLIEATSKGRERGYLSVYVMGLAWDILMFDEKIEIDKLTMLISQELQGIEPTKFGLITIYQDKNERDPKYKRVDWGHALSQYPYEMLPLWKEEATKRGISLQAYLLNNISKELFREYSEYNGYVIRSGRAEISRLLSDECDRAASRNFDEKAEQTPPNKYGFISLEAVRETLSK